MPGEPFSDLVLDLAQRRLLDRLDGNELATIDLQCGPRPVEFLRNAPLCITLRLQGAKRFIEFALRRGAALARLLLGGREFLRPGARRQPLELRAFLCEPLALSQQARKAGFDLLDPGPLDERQLGGVGGITAERFPALLPVGHGGLGRRKRSASGMLGPARRLQFRLRARE